MDFQMVIFVGSSCKNLIESSHFCFLQIGSCNQNCYASAGPVPYYLHI